MFTKQNLLATLAATVGMFLIGYLIWGMAMVSFFESHTLVDVMKPDEEMNLGLIFLGNLAAAFGMATLYGKWAAGNYGFAGGFTFGAWVGVIIGIGMAGIPVGAGHDPDFQFHGCHGPCGRGCYRYFLLRGDRRSDRVGLQGHSPQPGFLIHKGRGLTGRRSPPAIIHTPYSNLRITDSKGASCRGNVPTVSVTRSVGFCSP